jgi:hypothetical protein
VTLGLHTRGKEAKEASLVRRTGIFFDNYVLFLAENDVSSAAGLQDPRRGRELMFSTASSPYVAREGDRRRNMGHACEELTGLMEHKLIGYRARVPA